MGDLVIGFGHKRRRGKSLCGELMLASLQALDVPARSDSFALSIKEGICRGVFGFSEQQIYGSGKFEVDPFWGFTPRYVMQLAGTEAMRTTFGDDIWIRTLERRRALNPGVVTILTDVRFPNEVEAIKRMGGYVVRVDRPVEEIPDDATSGADKHASEVALDGYSGWSAVVMNDGSKADLLVKIAELTSSILSGRFTPNRVF